MFCIDIWNWFFIKILNALCYLFSESTVKKSQIFFLEINFSLDYINFSATMHIYSLINFENE